MKKVNEERAARFVALVKAKGWSQKETGRQLAVTSNHVNMIMNGYNSPSRSLLKRLEEKLTGGVTQEWLQFHHYQEVIGRECTITLQERPHYCDRGAWLAKAHPKNGTRLSLDLDVSDGWPRYYFDEIRAKLECEAWLKKREQI